jgi:hypothetical protein
MEAKVAVARPTFEDFFGTEHARLFGVLCFGTGDRDEAEEIMQDAFELRGGDIERIQVSSVGVQSTGWSSRRANRVKPGCCSTGAMSRHSSRD